jgi:O-acetyl-ADP-ribose deacetylase (regulator of RNase III)
VIERTRGDIIKADAEALVNTVNCVGVMGRGIALQFRKAFPENYKDYKAVCDRKELSPGKLVVTDLGRLTNPRYIINFPTKRHWKGKSRMEDIEAGLDSLIPEVQRLGIRSIAVPPLGCGLGGLNWDEVRPRIERAFEALPDVHVLLFEPGVTPKAETMARERRVPGMTVGRAALVGLMRRYLAAAMDPFVTLLEIHKLMYFMQEAGQPLRLDYRKGVYGPYSRNLRHVLNALEGHMIAGYGDAADNPTKEISLKPGAAEAAEDFLEDNAETRERFGRVVDLIEGFETPYAMELLATVHWVGKHEDVHDVDTAVKYVYDWNERKAMFPREHIEAAWNVLATKRWLGTDTTSSVPA